MSTINRLSSVDALQPGDLIPVWDGSNGDTRKASLTTLLAFIESNFADPDYSTRIVAPTVDGFNVDIGNTGDSYWLIVNPALNYTAGSVTLPPAASAVNEQEVTIVFTASVTYFSITSTGATVQGAPTQMGVYDSFRVRYNASQLTWYTLDTTGDSTRTAAISATDFTGDGVTTTFTLTTLPGALGESLQVFVDGVYQDRDLYSISGFDVIFVTAPVNTASIEVLEFAVNEIGATSSNLVTYTPGGTSVVVTRVQDKLQERVSPADFGAVGDADAGGNAGTDDTTAFTNLELSFTNRIVDMSGKIYMVSSPIPAANNYINGKFVVPTATTDDQPVNFALGYNALVANTFVPLQWPSGAGIDYASGNYNTAFGDTALRSNTIGRRNTALGALASYTNTTGAYNTSVGALALFANTIGEGNTAIGVQALESNVSGSDNVSVGSGSMAQHTVSADCVAIGRQSLSIATGSTARTIAIGRQAAWKYETGADTVAIGYQALSNDGAVGSYNIAVGSAAMGAATTANSSVGIGRRALSALTTGDGNVAVGNDAMVSATGGNGTVAIGNTANPNNTTGSNNVFVGAANATANSTGYSNVAIGRATFTANTTGYNNVVVGEQAGTTNTTGFRNTYVGVVAGTAGTVYAETSALGYNAQVTANYQCQIGGTGTTTYAYGAVQDRSDMRDKTDIQDTALGLSFINTLRPVDFKWDMRDDYRAPMPEALSVTATDEEKAAHEVVMANWVESNRLGNIKKDGSKKRSRFHHGVIAQEVQAVIAASGVDFGGFQNHAVGGGEDVMSIGYEEFIAPLIKAVQELSAQVELLKNPT